MAAAEQRTAPADRSYLDRIRDKTGRRRRPELTRLAIQEGLGLSQSD
ncbi:MAG TPA: hypothetical protein VHX38_09295 [Pseudonocardiaceae bacterium]|jgi:hypothetical protein|nr:hypothetical protein [Pseudonocardiaceae bacterium]